MEHCKFKSILFLSVFGLALVGSVLAQQSSSATTTKSPTTTTPVPTPPQPTVNCTATSTKPKLHQNVYQFSPCILVKFAAYFMPAPGQYVELNNGHVNSNASKCEADTQWIRVDFGCGSVHFLFGKNGQSVYVKSIDGSFSTGGNTTMDFSNSTESIFSTKLDHYYKCNTEQSISSDPKDKAAARPALVFSDVAIEAFRQSNSTDFVRVAEDCPLDASQVSDLVRIGVGVCLVALVALVLIAYFVGKRRWSERSSYESV